jgi:SAM-dependent methyltransferase
MTFDVAADAYDRFMGRHSTQLSAPLADLAGIEDGQRVIDVGCGPGALTAELVRRLGADAVTAVDPSETFAATAEARHPGVDVRLATAEELPFPDGAFDAALAQLVVHFMDDPVAGLREMARVTRPGGIVAASVWDLAGGRSPLSAFWAGAQACEPSVEGEGMRPGARAGHLAELLAEAGLREIEETELVSSFEYESFEDWWLPYTRGVGPAGAYVASLDEASVAELRERCRTSLPEAPFTSTSTAWAARGRV